MLAASVNHLVARAEAEQPEEAGAAADTSTQP